MVVCCNFWSNSLCNDFTLLFIIIETNHFSPLERCPKDREAFKMNRKLFLIIVFLIIVLPVEAQCAMCRAVLESEAGQNTAKGINNGIVYLMVIPYILIGGLGFFIYRKLKNK